MSCLCNCCYLISIIWLYSATCSPFLNKNRKIEKERAKIQKHGLCHRGLQQFTPHYECLPKNRSCMCAQFSHTPLPKTNKQTKKDLQGQTDFWWLWTLTFCPMKRSFISSLSYDLTLITVSHYVSIIEFYRLWQHTKEKASNRMNGHMCLFKIIRSLLWHIYS